MRRNRTDAVDDIEFFVALEAAEAPAAEPWTREIAQRLAREAGYAGAFGGGGFMAALTRDPALNERHERLLAEWRSAHGDAAAISVRRAALASLPRLDRALHHLPPSKWRATVGRARRWTERFKAHLARKVDQPLAST